MTVDTEAVAPTLLVCSARVRRVERLSPAFVRVVLESPAFTDLAELGFDTRFKLVFPGQVVRTYTVRDVVEEGADRLLVVDLVVHEGPVEELGPACRWALSAQPGDEVQVVAPHRRAEEYGGTEFAPGDRSELLLVGDETAVPAIARILADLDASFTGRAFIEVPDPADVLHLTGPADVEVTWLPRSGAEHGRRVVDEVRGYLGLGPLDPAAVAATLPSSLDVEVWETPAFSSAGESLDARTFGSDLGGLYAWIAGESWLVKALRRTLVTELGADRSQVAFMGYWREGVAMKS